MYFPPEEGDDGDAIVVARKVPNSPRATTLNTGEATSLEKSRRLPAGTAPIAKGKSRKWAAQPKDGSGGVDLSATSTQVRVKALPKNKKNRSHETCGNFLLQKVRLSRRGT